MAIQDFRGKTAFITGAASGMGRGMARNFAQAGINIALADIDLQTLDEARDEIGALGVVARGYLLDVSDRAADVRNRRRGRARFRQGAHRLQQCRRRLRRAVAGRNAGRDFRLDVRGQHDGADQRLQGVRAQAQEARRGRAHRQHRVDRRRADRAGHEQRHLCRHQVRGGGAVGRHARRDGAARYRRLGAVSRRRRHQHLSRRPRPARSFRRPVRARNFARRWPRC